MEFIKNKITENANNNINAGLTQKINEVKNGTDAAEKVKTNINTGLTQKINGITDAAEKVKTNINTRVTQKGNDVKNETIKNIKNGITDAADKLEDFTGPLVADVFKKIGLSEKVNNILKNDLNDFLQFLAAKKVSDIASNPLAALGNKDLKNEIEQNADAYIIQETNNEINELLKSLLDETFQSVPNEYNKTISYGIEQFTQHKIVLQDVVLLLDAKNDIQTCLKQYIDGYFDKLLVLKEKCAEPYDTTPCFISRLFEKYKTETLNRTRGNDGKYSFLNKEVIKNTVFKAIKNTTLKYEYLVDKIKNYFKKIVDEHYTKYNCFTSENTLYYYDYNQNYAVLFLDEKKYGQEIQNALKLVFENLKEINETDPHNFIKQRLIIQKNDNLKNIRFIEIGDQFTFTIGETKINFMFAELPDEIISLEKIPNAKRLLFKLYDENGEVSQEEINMTENPEPEEQDPEPEEPKITKDNFTELFIQQLCLLMDIPGLKEPFIREYHLVTTQLRKHPVTKGGAKKTRRRKYRRKHHTKTRKLRTLHRSRRRW